MGVERDTLLFCACAWVGMLFGARPNLTAQSILMYRIQDPHLCALRWEGAALLNSMRLKVARLHQSQRQGKTGFLIPPGICIRCTADMPHTQTCTPSEQVHTQQLSPKKCVAGSHPLGFLPAMQTTLSLLVEFKWTGRVLVV